MCKVNAELTISWAWKVVHRCCMCMQWNYSHNNYCSCCNLLKLAITFLPRLRNFTVASCICELVGKWREIVRLGEVLMFCWLFRSGGCSHDISLFGGKTFTLRGGKVWARSATVHPITSPKRHLWVAMLDMWFFYQIYCNSNLWPIVGNPYLFYSFFTTPKGLIFHVEERKRQENLG